MSANYFYLKNIDVQIIDKKYDICTSDFTTNADGDGYVFSDELKTVHKCSVINAVHSRVCWWCRYEPNCPNWIFCPIKILNDYEMKTYYSFTKNTHYEIKERVRKTPRNYICDGAFCSINCCAAYIKDNQHNVVYKDSLMLLKQYFYEQTGALIDPIPAPDWRVLKEFGGIVDIDTFRKNNETSLQSHGMVVLNRSMLVEKKIKF